MDFTASGLVIDTVTIVTQSITTENGQVDWKLEGGEDIVQDLALNSGMCLTLFKVMQQCSYCRLQGGGGGRGRGGRGALWPNG